MKKNKIFKAKVWMVGRIDQSILLADFLSKKKILVRWDSFIRLSNRGILRFFFKDSKRIMNDNLVKIPGNHYLPELIYKLVSFFGFKKGHLFQDLILAYLAKINFNKNFDIIHGQGPYSLEAATLAKRHGKKFVYEISGQMQATRKKQLKNVFKRYNLPLDTGINFLQKRRIQEAKIADLIICPSLILKKELYKLGFNKKKIITYKHDSNFSKELIKIKRNKITKKFILMFVGEISIAKGVQHAIFVHKKLIAAGINSELHLFGKLKHNFLVDDLDKTNIHFHGQVRKKILKKFYSKSDLFIFPSYTEGSALVIYEAMAAGIPIITTKEAGSIVKHKFNGYICKANDENQMFLLAKKIAKNKNLRIQMGKNSRKIYLEEMKTSYPKQVMKIYSTIIN